MIMRYYSQMTNSININSWQKGLKTAKRAVIIIVIKKILVELSTCDNY